MKHYKLTRTEFANENKETLLTMHTDYNEVFIDHKEECLDIEDFITMVYAWEPSVQAKWSELAWSIPLEDSVRTTHANDAMASARATRDLRAGSKAEQYGIFETDITPTSVILLTAHTEYQIYYEFQSDGSIYVPELNAAFMSAQSLLHYLLQNPDTIITPMDEYVHGIDLDEELL